MKTNENINNERGRLIVDSDKMNEFSQQFAANTDDVFAIWTPESEILFINNQFENIFHRPASEIQNNISVLLEWIYPADLDRIKQKSNSFADLKFLESGFRFRIVLPDKNESWLWYRGKALRDKDGRIFRYIGVISDITDFRKVQKELLVNSLSFDKNDNALIWFRENGSIIYTNQAARKLYGYIHQEITEQNYFGLIHSEKNEENWQNLWNTYKKSGITTVEQKHIRKDGSIFPAEVRIIYFQFEGAEYIFAYVTDVTERKMLETGNSFRRNFEHLIFNISTRFINLNLDDVDINIDMALKEICNFLQKNATYIFIYDQERAGVILKHFYFPGAPDTKIIKELTFPFEKDSWHYQSLLDQETIQIKALDKFDKKDILMDTFLDLGILSFSHLGLFYQNKLIGFFGLASKSKNGSGLNDEIELLRIVGDIFINASERKHTIQKLQYSEQTYREIYNASVDAIVIHDAETGKIVDVNQSMLDMFEISYEEALTINIGDLSDTTNPSKLSLGIHLIHKAQKNPQVFEWKSKTKSGKAFWTEVSLRSAKIHGATRIVALIRNINDRKLTEGLLKKSEEQYRMIIEGQNDLIVKLDLNGNFNFVSLSFCKMFGKTEEEFLGKPFRLLVHEEDMETTNLAMENLYNPPHTCYIEQRAKTANGWKWLAWNDTAILDHNAEVLEIIGVGRDITYQKMVENALRESEEQFRSIVQNLSDVVFLLDEKGNIKYVTPSCEEYLGHTIEELLGYSIFDLIHDEDRWLAEENIQLHNKGNDYTVPYEVRMKHYSTSWRVFEVKSQSMLNHPSVKSVIYTISDITERKLMEKQVLDAIIKTEEKERERFAKDLHDDLGPLLSSIKMYIGMLDKTTDKKKQRFIIDNLYDIVKESIATTKEVSNDLNPHVLNNYGLISAIELFIEKVSSEIKVDFEQNLDSARYAPAIELSLYRISKELINNTIKHANAQQIKLRYHEKDARLSLYYEDDGSGLPPGALKAKKPGGMGLSNIISRAKSLNASYNFHTKSTKGFKFEMHVPLIQD